MSNILLGERGSFLSSLGVKVSSSVYIQTVGISLFCRGLMSVVVLLLDVGIKVPLISFYFR